MSTQEKPMSQRLTDVAIAADKLTQTVQEQVGIINTTLTNKSQDVDNTVQSAKNSFDSWKNSLVQNINGLNVHKQGNLKRFLFKQFLSSGGYKHGGGGPDIDFPSCANPQPPYYVNLLEFNSTGNSMTFGNAGDFFKIEFIMCHRGMFASEGYTDHLVFTGTSYQDSVAGQLEIKKIAQDGVLSIFTSEPATIEKEIPLTNALEGTTVPVSFRTIGQGYDQGKARITLKIDTRYHCGSTRAISVDTSYTSEQGQPAINRISQDKPTWEQ